MPLCWIGLGGNQGRVADTFVRALDRLAATPGVTPVAISRHYRTFPMGTAAGNAFFLNAVAGLNVSLPALELLDVLQDVERQCGRVRTIRWGPRTLDLDLLAYGDDLLDTPRLTVPHPDAWRRRFVLDPWTALAPTWVHPVWRLSLAELRDRLTSQPHYLSLFGVTEDFRCALNNALVALRQKVVISVADNTVAESGGLVVQMDNAETPRVPRLRLDANLPRDATIETILDAVQAAFDEPVVVD